MSPRGRKLLCSPAPKQTHILGTSWHEIHNEKENTSPGRVCTHWHSPTDVDYVHIVLSHRLRHKRMHWIECFVFFFLPFKKKKKIFQKLTQTRRNHKPNPAVLGFNHLCGFKNKMSVQLQDLQGLNISKHRKGWVVFFFQCQATLVTGFSFMIFKHAPQLFCLSNTQSYKDF